ncbi:MAG TPA: response regulator [Cellvibrionaceae bacterium]|nr:response regulator [Cellvibrionaceae bacterium]HMY39508.1 response regulator [Marinagarivorans sp.]HNG61136.1 response regulator [Cellvibrionaceae bacterium]
MERVLIIDDDRFTQNVLQKSLYKHYETRTADNGAVGLSLAQNWHPDAILLDVEMPGQNGFEVCDVLKRDKATQEIPVIFLSSRSSIRERMLGFEVGADDYLTKPCSQEMLTAKLQKIIALYHQRNELRDTIKTAEQTALEAMATSFELGKAIRFVEKSYNYSTVERLGAALIEVMESLDLNACVRLNSRFATITLATGGDSVKPLEQDLMAMLHTEQRFVDFGCRSQINYPGVALLVKNMPLDNRARYGRLKDTLPFVLGACDAKLRMLDAEHALMLQNRELSNSVLSVQRTLSDVSQLLVKNQRAIGAVMSDLTTELSVHMNKLGLEGDQEEFIHHKVDVAANKLYSCVAEGNVVENILSGIAELLRQMSSEQARIISETLSTQMANQDESITSDVELF